MPGKTTHDTASALRRRFRPASDYAEPVYSQLIGDVGASEAEHYRQSIAARRGKLTVLGGSLKRLAPRDTKALAEFEAIITSNRVDRHGDILDPRGATIDPAMPLLWQHVPELPIGRMLEISHRDDEVIAGRFAIADTELGRDAATLMELGALRVSHGFFPREVEDRYDDQGQKAGFIVNAFDIFEASLVSVPANIDAVIVAHERRKLAHPLVRSWAGRLSNHRRVQDRGVTFATNAPHDAASLSNGVSPMNTDQHDGADDITSTEDRLAAIESRLEKAMEQLTARTEREDSSITPYGLLVGGGKSTTTGGRVDVKDPSGMYSLTKSAATHVRTGQPVRNERGADVVSPSQYEHAMAGALFKMTALRAGINVDLTEHDRALIHSAVSKSSWCGRIGHQWETGVHGERVKALLNDGTSGGLEINPEWFDSMLITFPLLNGELLPFVDVHEVPRASSVEGASVGNPTVTWGTAEGTALSLFNTASLVAEINTSIHPVAVAIEVGKDFLADAAVEVGRVLAERVGERLKTEFDKVIAVGNGTTQPTGIFTASGLTTTSATNPTTGPLTVGDYEQLIAAVGKPYRNRSDCAFISTDTMYFRGRGIAAGSDNATRVFGMNHSNYSMLEYPYRVCNDCSDGAIAFGNLKRYRMYRRMGISLEWHTHGQTLALKNTALLVARARIGGRIVDTSAFAKVTNAATQ